MCIRDRSWRWTGISFSIPLPSPCQRSIPISIPASGQPDFIKVPFPVPLVIPIPLAASPISKQQSVRRSRGQSCPMFLQCSVCYAENALIGRQCGWSILPTIKQGCLLCNTDDTRSRECVHLVSCVHFRSGDKDGGHTSRSAISQNPVLHARKLHSSIFYKTGVIVDRSFRPTLRE